MQNEKKKKKCSKDTMKEESRRAVKYLHKEADKAVDEVELPGVY